MFCTSSSFSLHLWRYRNALNLDSHLRMIRLLRSQKLKLWCASCIKTITINISFSFYIVCPDDVQSYGKRESNIYDTYNICTYSRHVTASICRSILSNNVYSGILGFYKFIGRKQTGNILDDVWFFIIKLINLFKKKTGISWKPYT